MKLATEEWVLTNLMRVANACRYLYNTPSTIERTHAGSPYIKVSTGKVRVLFYPRHRRMRVYVNGLVDKDDQQLFFDFSVARQSDAEYKAVASFAAETVSLVES